MRRRASLWATLALCAGVWLVAPERVRASGVPTFRAPENWFLGTVAVLGTGPMAVADLVYAVRGEVIRPPLAGLEIGLGVAWGILWLDGPFEDGPAAPLFALGFTTHGAVSILVYDPDEQRSRPPPKRGMDPWVRVAPRRDGAIALMGARF